MILLQSPSVTKWYVRNRLQITFVTGSGILAVYEGRGGQTGFC